MSKFRCFRQATLSATLLLNALLLTSSALAVTVEDALVFVPVQKNVDYDRPAAKDVAKCSVKAEEMGGVSAWVVRGPSGEILRCFTDTNRDNRVDQWRYYASGIESYRDMDTNFNGKADQHRWLGLSGLRWGVDENEDGQIDRWQMISPEEVSAEIVGAIQDKDASRFAAVLATPADIESLGLDADTQRKLAARVANAVRRFRAAVAGQNAVDARARWVHFSATRPGVLPAETNGNERDIFVYENVAAMLDQGQVPIGTFVKAGDQWKAIDIPLALMSEDEKQDGSSFLLTSANVADQPPMPEAGEVLSENMRKLLTEVDEIDKAIVRATPAQKAKLYDRQATIWRELASSAKSKEDQAVWIRSLAETLSTAVETGDYPDGAGRLEKLYKELAGQAKEAELTGYVKYRLLRAQYATQLQDPEQKNFGKVQDWWVAQLEDFVEEYPSGPDVLEAMLQLAMAEEFAGNDKPALRWYERIIASGRDGLDVEKARGAEKRLNSVGEKLDFGGTMVNGKAVQASQFKGRYVLIHYWATWCDTCKDDMKVIQSLLAKYGKQFMPIGVNLDAEQAKVAEFLKESRLPWPQIYEEGGLDSRPAVDLGILSVPTMILLDEQGEVINRNIHVAELSDYLEKNLK